MPANPNKICSNRKSLAKYEVEKESDCAQLLDRNYESECT